MLNRYFKSNIRKYALVGAFFGILFPVLASIIKFLASNSSFSFSTLATMHFSDPLLWIIDTAPFFLSAIASIAGHRQDQVEILNEQLRAREDKVFQHGVALEKRIEERTGELEEANRKNQQKAIQFRAITEVVQVINNTKNLQQLLPQVTQVISEQFGFYHVAIFLNDSTNQYAILSGANSEGGKRLMARGHRLKIGDKGIVGYVTEAGKPRIALDIGVDAVYFDNPEFSETHSEICLPLKSGDKTIGALDVHSTMSTAYSGEDVDILSTLADQVSLAIENTRLFEQTQRALTESEAISRQYLRQTWGNLSPEKQVLGFRYASGGVAPIPPTNELSTEEVNNENSRSVVTVPIQLRGTTIGTLKIAMPEDGRTHQNQMDLINAVAERVALAAENARLFEETSRRAERERIISDIANKMGASFRTENILSTTAKELSQFLEGAEILIQLGTNGNEKK